MVVIYQGFMVFQRIVVPLSERNRKALKIQKTVFNKLTMMGTIRFDEIYRRTVETEVPHV